MSKNIWQIIWQNTLVVTILFLGISLLFMALLAIFGYHWQGILAVTAIILGIPFLFITPLIVALAMPDKDKAENTAFIGGLIAVMLSFIICKIIFPNF